MNLWTPFRRLWLPRDRRGVWRFSPSRCCGDQCPSNCTGEVPDTLEVSLEGVVPADPFGCTDAAEWSFTVYPQLLTTENECVQECITAWLHEFETPLPCPVQTLNFFGQQVTRVLVLMIPPDPVYHNYHLVVQLMLDTHCLGASAWLKEYPDGKPSCAFDEEELPWAPTPTDYFGLDFSAAIATVSAA